MQIGLQRDLRVQVNGRLNKLYVSQQYAQIAKRANPVLGCIRRSITSQSREVTVLLCTSVIPPGNPWRSFGHLILGGSSNYQSALKRVAMMVQCLGDKTNEEWQRSLSCSVWRKEGGGCLIILYDFFKRDSIRIQVNGMNLHQRKFRLDIRKRFFTGSQSLNSPKLIRIQDSSG